MNSYSAEDADSERERVGGFDGGGGYFVGGVVERCGVQEAEEDVIGVSEEGQVDIVSAAAE